VNRDLCVLVSGRSFGLGSHLVFGKYQFPDIVSFHPFLFPW
jgi:hypothetical protein